jgi:hypothetical protein
MATKPPPKPLTRTMRKVSDTLRKPTGHHVMQFDDRGGQLFLTEAELDEVLKRPVKESEAMLLTETYSADQIRGVFEQRLHDLERENAVDPPSFLRSPPFACSEIVQAKIDDHMRKHDQEASAQSAFITEAPQQGDTVVTRRWRGVERTDDSVPEMEEPRASPAQSTSLAVEQRGGTGQSTAATQKEIGEAMKALRAASSFVTAQETKKREEDI